tara:strand:- start:203 stop:850 length:648 start_codon:yes stop_codon:yes gene_type:complete
LSDTLEEVIVKYFVEKLNVSGTPDAIYKYIRNSTGSKVWILLYIDPNMDGVRFGRFPDRCPILLKEMYKERKRFNEGMPNYMIFNANEGDNEITVRNIRENILGWGGKDIKFKVLYPKTSDVFTSKMGGGGGDRKIKLFCKKSKRRLTRRSNRSRRRSNKRRTIKSRRFRKQKKTQSKKRKTNSYRKYKSKTINKTKRTRWEKRKSKRRRSTRKN